VVGGLLFSQFLTLFVTPVFFVYMESFQSWIRKWLPSKSTVGELEPAR
jgi:HAE1 family hydrophobic/amphiphilic exporter-1